ncbi:uncharacterized protein CDV56_106725 [Aspergillus thermomutatus]|uniref:Uncharacterized protein n=1 Tax=Aspergillus thermomutatus TaxID=41047 RepID=A0A397GYZ0_ASPTH|nr:uncharacterized protein CDV56_106725 [Aspergillus thermomutatus]RHZ54858.1 hypothetical protein CDV56_106725 [Aspergillus thermomutatus]
MDGWDPAQEGQGDDELMDSLEDRTEEELLEAETLEKLGNIEIDQERENLVRGRVCGLLYGGTTNYCGPPGNPSFNAMAGLVTDITELSQSVKLRTVPRDEYGNVTGAPAELGLPEPP